MANVQFGTKIGLIAATVGSAVGLGNIWRFPAEAYNNGGGAFLIVYFICVLLLGIPVMLGEFIIGRDGGTDAVGDYKKLAPRTAWWLVGGMGLLASYLILSYYNVVAGWTLEYMYNSLTGSLYEGIDSSSNMDGAFQGKMTEYIKSDFTPIIFTFIILAVNAFVLIKGVQKGIERMSNMMMPLLFVILLVFCAVAFTLPNASTGIEYFLTPDFSKITPSVVINALGQAFFSLSLGMGTLITYASYYPKKTRLIGTATTVSMLDMFVSIMMGLIIFPAVASFGMMGSGLGGKTVVFVTLPEVFEQMPGTQIWSILFFLLLFVAALTSTISIAEVSVRFFQERLKVKRWKAVLLVILPLFPLGAICSLSEGRWSSFTWMDLNIFGMLDYFSSNILLPLGSLLMCIFLGWFAPKKLMSRQLTNNGSLKSRLVTPIIFLIRWVAPVAIIMVFASQFINN